MLGTLAGALEARHIPAGSDRLSASVEADVGAADRVLRITGIRVHYTLTVPPGTREAAERAIATHEQKCPAATSVRGCIPITISSDITESSTSS
ncbi:MAG TPA: OsmC family protein [Vicinamibacterales bacterium]|nr:OsmC family protein [Vicinamibacterales bacterium]